MDVILFLECFFIMVVTILVSIYTFFLFSYNYWKRRNVPYLKPTFPKGNCRDFFSHTRGYCLELMDLYNKMKSRKWKFGGIYGLARPILLITDPSYMKDILIKDFHHFKDRGFYYIKSEPLTANLFVMDELDWKNMRSKLTPTFTSGKMKMMFPLMLKASDGLIEALEKLADKNEDIDIKEFVTMFTTDVIVSCAFGIESNCFTDPNHKFRNIGKGMLEPKHFWDSIRFTLMNYAPDLAYKIGLRSFNQKVAHFFENIIKTTLNYRKENNINRNDFLQLVNNLMETTKYSDNPFTFDQLVAQVFIFFLAGFDTTSSTMSFVLYELSRNSDIQNKLRDEIITTLKRNGNEITYEVINDMTYLQQVIDETLRLYPPVPILQRRCIEDYTLKNTNVVIEKGIPIVMPIISIHRDAEFFPEPMKFDPERFNEKNKGSMDPTWYLPFGDGPRNCLGLRFGLMEAKVGLIQILKKFKVNISPSTKMPLTLDEKLFLIKTEETLYIKAEKI